MRRPWWWVLIPVLTCGLGSGPIVVYGGARLRSRAHIASGIGYLALAATCLVTSGSSSGGLRGAIFLVALVGCWLGGTAHTAVLAAKASPSGAAVAGPAPVPAIAPRPVDPALAAAEERLARRAEARALVESNPVLATELRIGRPDLPRQYNDGGLVDVNNVPAAVLVSELALPPEIAEQIVTERDRLVAFGSADELVVYCDRVNPSRVDSIRDRLLFLPR